MTHPNREPDVRMLAQRYASESVRRVEGLTRDESCMKYRNKVLILARRIHERLPPGAPFAVEDLAGYGAIGLIEAFDRHDGARGISFGTFAEYRIRGAIYDALRGNDAFTRRRRMLAKKVEATTAGLSRQLGRAPEPREVAEALEVDMEEYWQIADRVAPISTLSLDAPLDDGSDATLLDRVLVDEDPGMDRRLIAEEVRTALKEAIEGLPDKQRQCVLMYYGKGLSLAECGAVLEVTASRISQILTEARGRLQKRLAPWTEDVVRMLEVAP